LLRRTSTAASIRGFQTTAFQSDKQPALSLASTTSCPWATNVSTNSDGNPMR
jgi:hypothetical protein